MPTMIPLGFICTFLLVLASHHFEISPGTHHFSCSITVESLLHFYSLLLPCALHKIITHEWTRLNPATLAVHKGSFMLISSEQSSQSSALTMCHHMRDHRSCFMLKIAGLNMYEVVLIFIIHSFSSLSLVLKGCFMESLLDEWKRLKVAAEWCVAF